MSFAPGPSLEPGIVITKVDIPVPERRLPVSRDDSARDVPPCDRSEEKVGRVSKEVASSGELVAGLQTPKPGGTEYEVAVSPSSESEEESMTSSLSSSTSTFELTPPKSRGRGKRGRGRPKKLVRQRGGAVGGGVEGEVGGEEGGEDVPTRGKGRGRKKKGRGRR